MKKYIYLAIALVMGVFASCTDKDDIEIVYHHDVTVTVNTSKLYETWGITNFQNLLGTFPFMHVGVNTLVYDNNGNLCDSLFTVKRTIEPITQQFSSLKEGTYTFLTFQTQVSSLNRYKNSYYDLDKINSLDSVMVVSHNQSGLDISWFNCFAVATQTVNVKKGADIAITPEPVGCIIEFEIENFNKSNYDEVGLYFKNAANGYYLNPKLEDKDRFYYENSYLEQNVWHPCARITNSEFQNTNKNQRFLLQTGDINYCIGAGYKAEDGLIHFTAYPSRTEFFKFDNGQKYKAYCYYEGAPTYVKTFTGNYADFDAWYKDFDKKMNPIYAEPCTKWGTLVSYVKAYMYGYDSAWDLSEYPGGFTVGYEGKYREVYTEYDFTERNKGLYQSYIAILESEASVEDIMAQINGTDYEYDQYYEFEGLSYHLYYDDNTYVAIMPGQQFQDGTPFTLVQYLSRAFSDGQSSNVQKSKELKTNMISKSRIPVSLLKVTNINR